MACSPPNTAYDGNCYLPCPDGWETVDNTYCRKACPFGYLASETACIRPVVPRVTLPIMECPSGATRVYDQCLLACPAGTTAQFEMCMPSCPDGFVDSPDGLSCISELVPRPGAVREACYQGETRVGDYCLAPCTNGTAVYPLDATMCYRTLPPELQNYFVTYGSTSAKVRFQRTIVPSTCPRDYVSKDGVCYAPCPSGTTAGGAAGPAGSDSAQCKLACPPGFPSVNGGCMRPTLMRTQYVSTASTWEKYFKYVLIAVLVFIVFNFGRKLFGRKV